MKLRCFHIVSVVVLTLIISVIFGYIMGVNNKSSIDDIEVIDLFEAKDTIVKKLRTACTEVGFFYIINHGVPQDLIDNTFAQSKLFFGKEKKYKLEVERPTPDLYRGYDKFERECVNPPIQKQRGGTKEGYLIGADAVEKNRWPTESANLPEFRDSMEEYFKVMSELSKRLVHLLALALDLDENYFDEYFTTDPLALLKLLHYNEEQSDVDKGVYACGPHSDYGMLTVLATDGVPGLQVRTSAEKEVWEDVLDRPGAFIVNLGDMLQHCTNGKFMSTKHRVLNLKGLERYSIPFFWEPSADAVLTTIKTCVGDEHPAKESVTYGEYIARIYAATHPKKSDGDASDTEQSYT
eukprot:50119_1